MTIIIRRICLILLLLAPTMLSAQAQRSEFVVFIHAGGGPISEEALREIGAMLVKKGYVVRTPDRERDETGGPGVDFFSTFARDAAQDVADTVNARLEALKLLTNENRKLRPRLQLSVKNPPSYLGVWLF